MVTLLDGVKDTVQRERDMVLVCRGMAGP